MFTSMKKSLDFMVILTSLGLHCDWCGLTNRQAMVVSQPDTFFITRLWLSFFIPLDVDSNGTVRYQGQRRVPLVGVDTVMTMPKII